MPNLTCPSTDLNFLSPNGFVLQIERLPKVSFFTQQVALPGLTLPALDIATPLSIVEIPSDKMQFAPLELTFAVDEKMENWLEVFNWMKGLGFPEEYPQYTNENNRRAFISDQSAELPRNYSDAKLFVLGSNNTTVRTFSFVDCFPISIGGIQFGTTNTDVQYATSSITLEYTYFTVT
jgi:hypothetical protein